MSSDEKILILIRHAHRDTTQKELDNGLSEKGKTQARSLLKNLKAIYPLEEAKLHSSPKLRCIETLEPIAKHYSIEIKSDPLLIEQANNEKISDMKERISVFLKKWKENPNSLTLVCSHGDWLPLAVELATHAHCEFEKGSWAELAQYQEMTFIRFRNG